VTDDEINVSYFFSIRVDDSALSVEVGCAKSHGAAKKKRGEIAGCAMKREIVAIFAAMINE
jgi:hypothetical protein